MERPHLQFGEPIERASGEPAEASTNTCTACEACLPICPSQSLHLSGEGGRATRFELDLGSCIGCGRCIEICPESALVAMHAPRVLLPTPAGRLPRIDLLAENEPSPDQLQ